MFVWNILLDMAALSMFYNELNSCYGMFNKLPVENLTKLVVKYPKHSLQTICFTNIDDSFQTNTVAFRFSFDVTPRKVGGYKKRAIIPEVRIDMLGGRPRGNLCTSCGPLGSFGLFKDSVECPSLVFDVINVYCKRTPLFPTATWNVTVSSHISYSSHYLLTCCNKI